MCFRLEQDAARTEAVLWAPGAEQCLSVALKVPLPVQERRLRVWNKFTLILRLVGRRGRKPTWADDTIEPAFLFFCCGTAEFLLPALIKT